MKSANGTTMKTGSAMKAASKSGVRSGPSVPNGGRGSAPRGTVGAGAAGATKPIKGMDRGRAVK